MVKQFLFCCCIILLCLSACKKDEKNPYAPYNNPVIDSTTTGLLPPTSFAGLYQQIFFPTCANSGCHDGTFEPDFRTIESSYISLVYHAITKNDSTDPLTYRVYPFQADKSMLIRRLTTNLNGNSGFMPLVTDPGSDWPANKVTYIANIKQWITDGAKDISGNVANPVNKVPQMNGMIITAHNSNTPFPRDVAGVVQVPSGTTAFDIYLSVSDAETAAGSLVISSSKFSLSRDDFSNAVNLTTAVISPVTFTGYQNTPVSFYHKITVSDASLYWQSGNRVFVSLTVSDGTNTVSLPGLYAIDVIKSYYSIQIN